MSKAKTAEPMPEKKNNKKKFEDYEVQSAHDTLMKAAEHQANPDMMAAVAKLHAKKQKAMNRVGSLADLKSRARASRTSNLSMEDGDEGYTE